MLIDDLLPDYDVVERHQLDVRAPVERVYDAVRALDLSRSRTIRWLFLLRELPALARSSDRGNGRLGLTLDGLLRSGFVLLGEKPRQELVLGLVGRFWTPSGDIQRLGASGFRTFDRPGYAKAAWNFSLSERKGGNDATRYGDEGSLFGRREQEAFSPVLVVRRAVQWFDPQRNVALHEARSGRSKTRVGSYAEGTVRLGRTEDVKTTVVLGHS